MLLGVVGVLRRSAVSLRQFVNTNSETEERICTHRLLSLPLRREPHHTTLRKSSVGCSGTRRAKLSSAGSLRLPLLHHRTSKLPVPLLLSRSTARTVDSSRSTVRLLLLERSTVGDILGRSRLVLEVSRTGLVLLLAVLIAGRGREVRVRELGRGSREGLLLLLLLGYKGNGGLAARSKRVRVARELRRVQLASSKH